VTDGRVLVASAPGKLVVCGEYAVLDGAPAVAVAVDRRAVVRIEAGNGWSVTAPGFDDCRREFKLSASKVEWPSGASPLPLLDAVFRSLGRDIDTPLALLMDTAAFSAASGKLGLGSSAALAVATSGALAVWCGGTSDGLLRMAAAAHRELQAGRGSGVDVATAVLGGLVHYRMPDEVVRLDWPQGLHARVLYSGVPASTTARLDKLAATGRHPSRQALVAAANEAAAAWRSGNRDAVLEATAGYTASLADFSRAYDLGVFAAGHEALVTLAEREGLVYKPCGAGGGDAGMVLGREPDALEAFTAAAAQKGFQDLALDFDTTSTKGFTAAWTQD